jgi:hypothetical protein
MTNHFHLLLQLEDPRRLSSFMAGLLWSSPRKVDSKLRVLPFELRRGDIPQR